MEWVFAGSWRMFRSSPLCVPLSLEAEHEPLTARRETSALDRAMSSSRALSIAITHFPFLPLNLQPQARLSFQLHPVFLFSTSVCSGTSASPYRFDCKLPPHSFDPPRYHEEEPFFGQPVTPLPGPDRILLATKPSIPCHGRLHFASFQHRSSRSIATS